MTIEQSQKDDFYESIRRNGFDEKDFQLQGKDTSQPDPNRVYFNQMDIEVKRTSNGKNKSYQGYYTSWNSEFEDDLISGFFGNP